MQVQMKVYAEDERDLEKQIGNRNRLRGVVLDLFTLNQFCHDRGLNAAIGCIGVASKEHQRATGEISSGFPEKDCLLQDFRDPSFDVFGSGS